ncbi:MAG: RidA family protein [Chloroflexota bacterium]
MTEGARFHNPDTVHKPMGYSHVAEVTSGRLVYLAGQVAVDPAGNIVGESDIAAQTKQVFENLKNNLAAVGATFANVIKLSYFVLDAAHIPTIREVRNSYLNPDAMPTSTLVVVAGLARPEWLIEVEAVALLPV